jgi:hypothetical protein
MNENRKHIIEIPITLNQIKEAEKLYNFGSLNGSITKGDGNIFGALGEVAVYYYFKDWGVVDFTSTYDYDTIINGHKIDVKTKRCNYKPKDNYLCSISNFNTRQKCDYYFFCRVMTDYSKVFMLGYISKERFIF